MLKTGSRHSLHDYIHILGIHALAVGLVCSKAILSLSLILLVTNLVIERNYRSYWSNLRSSPVFLWISAFFILHLIALAWSVDFDYGFHDIRIKLSILLIPAVLIAKPIVDGNIKTSILWIFISTLFVTSLINVAAYFQFFGERVYADMRELSLFGSHIRYALLIVMGMASSIYLFHETSKKWLKSTLIFILFWFLFYTYFSQVLSGLMAIGALVIVLIIRQGFNYSRVLGFIVCFLVISMLSSIVFFLSQPEKQEIIRGSTLPKTTALGNAYTHNLDPSTFEGGRPVLANLCEPELRQAWNNRSEMPYDSLDQKGQVLRFVLMRYMTSLDLKKDAHGVAQLTSQDIQSIEQGIAHADAHNKGIFERLNEIRDQLHHTENPNGYTLLQRLEYWKTALYIIQENWVIGVGTGDVQIAFNSAYNTLNSKLIPENRLRAHNTYLTVWVSFGIVGLLLFLGMNIAIVRTAIRSQQMLSIAFIAIVLITFFIEDTLETQTGASFYGFFIGFLMQQKKEES